MHCRMRCYRSLLPNARLLHGFCRLLLHLLRRVQGCFTADVVLDGCLGRRIVNSPSTPGHRILWRVVRLPTSQEASRALPSVTETGRARSGTELSAISQWF